MDERIQRWHKLITLNSNVQQTLSIISRWSCHVVATCRCRCPIVCGALIWASCRMLLSGCWNKINTPLRVLPRASLNRSARRKISSHNRERAFMKFGTREQSAQIAWNVFRKRNMRFEHFEFRERFFTISGTDFSPCRGKCAHFDLLIFRFHRGVNNWRENWDEKSAVRSGPVRTRQLVYVFFSLRLFVWVVRGWWAWIAGEKIPEGQTAGSFAEFQMRIRAISGDSDEILHPALMKYFAVMKFIFFSVEVTISFFLSFFICR